MGQTLRAYGRRDAAAGNRQLSLRAILLATIAVFLVPTATFAADTTIDGTNETVIGGGSGTQTSPWNIGGQLNIADSATSSLIISAGGTVSDTIGIIGRYATGSATLTGTGSTWTNSSYFVVGHQATGTLNVSDGASLSNTMGYIGDISGSNGTVTLTDSGTTWTNSTDLRVGNSGTGTLTIANGASVSNSQGYIGYNSGSSGTVSVTGTGSTWTNTGDLFLGYSGTGTLTLADGGKATVNSGSGTLTVASQSGSSGTLNIGAASGASAVAAGTLDAASIAFGAGTGILVFNHTDANYNFALDVTAGTGTSTLSHQSGTTNLTGSVALNGDVTVDGGTLQVTSSGSLTNTTGYIGKTSGAGSVVVTGTGSSWMTSGALYIAQSGTGTLTVSDSGTVTAGTNLYVGYANTGILTVTIGGTVTVNGGSGSIAVGTTGTGTINIGAAAGATAAAAGTLNASSIDFGVIGGSVVFNHTGTAYDFGLDVTGSGALAFYSGTTKLTGDYSAFTGTATVNGGTMAVNTTFSNAISVLSGGTLGGSGTVSNVTLASGATVAPGNSIGTLNVSGDLTFVSGSTYEVEVDNAGNSDKIVATGTLTIDSGATLNILAENGTDDGSTYNNTTDYTILTAGTLTGAFGTVTDNFAYLDASVAYTATTATLTLTRNDIDFAALGNTSNQKQAGGAVESLGSGNAVYNAVQSLPTGQPAGAFDQLSGEAHATAQGLFMADATIGRDTVNQRIRGAFDGVTVGEISAVAFHGEGDEPLLKQIKAQVWSKSFGSWGESDKTSETARVTRLNGGFFLGVDAELIDGWRTGITGGYSYTSFSSAGGVSSGQANNYHGGIYAGTQFDAIALRLGAAYSWHTLDTERTVAFVGFSDRLRANYAAATAQAFAETGYLIALGRNRLEPFAGFALVHEHTDSFTETGGVAALTAKSNNQLLGVTSLGLRAETKLADLDGFSTKLTGSLAWRHAFGDVDPSTTMRFASGGDAFSVVGSPIDDNTARLEAGLALESGRNHFAFTYQGEIGAYAQEHGARATFAYRF